jgi:hypothetical protein
MRLVAFSANKVFHLEQPMNDELLLTPLYCRRLALSLAALSLS